MTSLEMRDVADSCAKAFNDGFERSVDIFNARTWETHELERAYDELQKAEAISLKDSVKLYIAQGAAVHAEYERGYKDATKEICESILSATVFGESVLDTRTIRSYCVEKLRELEMESDSDEK